MAEAIEMNNALTVAQAIAFLEEFQNVNIPLRLNSIQRLSAIALALGEERTRTELVPALTERTIGNPPNIGLALAEQLGELKNFVGGPDYAMHLIPPLESLATDEETVVREKAVESLINVASQLSAHGLGLHVIPTIRRLISGEAWNENTRVSACGLFLMCYPRVPATAKPELRNLFHQMRQDESPVVQMGVWMLRISFPQLMVDDEPEENDWFCGIQISPTMWVGFIMMSVVLIVLFSAFVIYPVFFR